MKAFFPWKKIEPDDFFDDVMELKLMKGAEGPGIHRERVRGLFIAL